MILLDLLAQYDPKVLEVLATLATTVFAVLSGLVAAIWTILQFLDERRKQRQVHVALEQERLEQQRLVEQGRRAERVATLISEFGKAEDPEARGWTTLALSLYPNETTRLLTMALGQCNEETAGAVRLALVGIGAPALPELTRLNRIARVFVDSDDAESEIAGAERGEHLQLLQRTQSVIVQLLFHLPSAVVAAEDLSEIDLSGCNLQGLRCEGLRLRKCRLHGTLFKKASIREAVFRGALVEQAVFLKTVLERADFTGAKGSLIAIKCSADGACFDHADLRGSQFDGASLERCRMQGTTLDDATLRGVQLHDSVFEHSHCNRIDATKVRAKRVHWKMSSLVAARLDEADLSESTFEQCKMMGLSAKNADARSTRFLNCNLGGIHFGGAKLSGAQFRGCSLGGADFRGCELDQAVFHNCQIETAKFDEGVVVAS